MDPKAFIVQVEAAWRSRARAPGVPPLTRLHVHIAAKLAFWQAPVCRQRALAKAAGCSVRTVRRATSRLKALGLLSWIRRVLCCNGWRAQIANRYLIGEGQKAIRFEVLVSTANVSPPGRVAVTQPVLPPDVWQARRELEALAEAMQRRRAGGGEAMRP